MNEEGNKMEGLISYSPFIICLSKKCFLDYYYHYYDSHAHLKSEVIYLFFLRKRNITYNV